MSKVYDCGLIVGRFQTFHVGHEHLIDTALKLCDRVLVLVGSSQECGTERNPLNVETRIRMLRQIYDNDKQVMIYALSDLTNENDNNFDWGQYLLHHIDRYIYKEPDCMVYGLSSAEEARATAWFDTDKLSAMNFMLVPRSTIPISATMLREMMVRDDRREWMKWVNPKLHKFYDELRNELMTVPYYQKLQTGLNTIA